MGGVFGGDDDVSDAIYAQQAAQEKIAAEQKKQALEERKTLINQQREQMGAGGGRYKTSTTGKMGLKGRIKDEEDILG